MVEIDSGRPVSFQARAVAYREKIINEIFYALGLSRNGVLRRLVGPLFRAPAGRFGRIAARVDEEVGRSGISGGARLILPDFSIRVIPRGAENIPRTGPLLMVSNHPGALDSVAVLSCIPRQDVKVLLSDVAFFRAFSNARNYFIYVPPDSAGKLSALRASISHLQSGGAVLIFAHGDVDPDPELGPDAGRTFRDWSRSVEIMLRRVPASQLQVTICSGALVSKFFHSPLVKVRKDPIKRQKLAEVMQISRQMIFPRSVRTKIHISFAEPVPGPALPKDELMPAVIKAARLLLEEHLTWLQASL